MIEHWRADLYHFGFVASILFGSRFIIQWIASEKRKNSYVNPLFWKLSILGNLSLALHSLIQVQVNVSLVQVCNTIFSWRNHNLMQDSSQHRSFRTVVLLLVASVLATIGLFALQAQALYGHFDWVRTPTMPWSQMPAEKLPLSWHILGTFGICIFASRFWVQWWFAEKYHKSQLGRSFWWLSIIGSLISLIYFTRMGDMVNIVGQGMSIIPAIRNLQLIHNAQKTNQSEGLVVNQAKHVDMFLFAGEQSGDNHGAKLLATLKQRHPGLQVAGVGGPEMRAEGLECIIKMEDFQVMGFTDVLLSLPGLYKKFRQIKQYILENNPKTIILIDYPDFNLRLAKALRREGYTGKLVQYVCPTIWAWRKGRIKDLVSSFDLLLTIFPFEAELFSHTPLKVVYAGNPTIHSIQDYPYNHHWMDELGIDKPKHLMAIFPGSRKGEIQHNLGKQLEAAELLLKDDPNIQFGLSIANSALTPMISNLIDKTKLEVGKNLFFVEKKYSYELMRECRSAIATSGTVTLELGLHRTPTTVVYHVSPFNWFMARFLFRLKLPNYCIVNITLNQRAFPELVHKDFTVQNLYRQASELYQETSLRKECVKKCNKLHELLDVRNADTNTVQAIENLL